MPMTWGGVFRDEIDFVDDAFLFATYDPPQQLINRYNEVELSPDRACDNNVQWWTCDPQA